MALPLNFSDRGWFLVFGGMKIWMDRGVGCVGLLIIPRLIVLESTPPSTMDLVDRCRGRGYEEKPGIRDAEGTPRQVLNLVGSCRFQTVVYEVRERIQRPPDCQAADLARAPRPTTAY